MGDIRPIVSSKALLRDVMLDRCFDENREDSVVFPELFLLFWITEAPKFLHKQQVALILDVRMVGECTGLRSGARIA